MKKKILMLIMTAVCAVMLFGCAVGLTKKVNVDITLTPENPQPGEVLTVKSSNRTIFKDRSEVGLVNFRANVFENNQFLYNCKFIGATLIEKISDYEARFQIKSCSTGADMNINGHASVNECGYTGWYTYKKSIRFDYSTYLTLSSSAAKAGDKITVTSSQAFFNTTSFSLDKVQKMVNCDYYIVWYTTDSGKKAVPKNNIEMNTLTPTSVTFTIPDDAITGTIHVINEGGFVVDGTNDIGLVGNVANAPAYYSTATELTINE
jgi:hypothetical protein